MQWACPQCGNLLKRGETLCRHCGTAIAIPPTLEAQWQASAGSTSRTVGWALAALVIGGLVVGGGIAFTRAFRSAQTQMGYAAGIDDFNRAADLYQKKSYEAAAALFNRVRQDTKNTDEILKKATEGELWCYRELGHAAQNRGDLQAAARWYRMALDVKPDDPQAKAEYEAVVKILGSAAPAGPSTTAPPPDRTTQHPQAPAAGTPNLKASDVEGGNARAAQEAQVLLSQANQAYRSGNLSEAVRLWSQVVSKAPGSPAAQQAQGQLTEYARQNNPFDQFR